MTLAMPSTVRMAAPDLEPLESTDSVGATAMHSATAADMYAAQPKLEEDDEAGRLGHPKAKSGRLAVEAYGMNPAADARCEITRPGDGRGRGIVARGHGENAMRACQHGSGEQEGRTRMSICHGTVGKPDKGCKRCVDLRTVLKPREVSVGECGAPDEER